MNFENLLQQFDTLPANLSNHLRITVVALAVGIAVSLPLSVYIVRHPRLRYPALTTVGVIQTIPSLALLALMVPVLLGVSALTATLVGLRFSALGFGPTVIALTLYSMLPMVRNGVTGIAGVDPAMTEAARGVGMTPRQVLWRVQLPLAAPVIIAGVRTATVWVVGIATLATPVGQRCLGNYIFRGLQTTNWTMVVFGCVAAAVLAIMLDLLIGGVERAVKDRRRGLGVTCGALLIAVFVVGLVSPAIARQIRYGAGGQKKVVWIGAKTFTEQYILADLIADQLRQAGFEPRIKESLGSTVVFDALAGGQIDCYVDYSGTIWANYMKRQRAADPQTVLDEMTDWLARRRGIRVVGPLGFENAYGLAMRADRARRLGVKSIGDLAPLAPKMTIGGDYEFFGRPEWRRIREVYGLNFGGQKSYDSTFMYRALVDGDVDVISAFTSDGRIAAYDLTVLDDPKNAIPPYDAVLLVSEDAAKRPGLVEALKPLVDSIPVSLMRRANYMVDRDDAKKKTSNEAAAWLRRQAIGNERDGSGG